LVAPIWDLIREAALLNSDLIHHCRIRIAHEEGCAREAGSPEAAEPHLQLAMLYKAQLELLSRTRVGTS
jgi:hypothetical protein